MSCPFPGNTCGGRSGQGPRSSAVPRPRALGDRALGDMGGVGTKSGSVGPEVPRGLSSGGSSYHRVVRTREVPKMLTVFLVDDHEMVRRGLTQLLEADDDMRVIGQAESRSQALARIPALHPDVVLLDVRLPDGSGIDVCRQLRADMPDLRCLMITAFPGRTRRAGSGRRGREGLPGQGRSRNATRAGRTRGRCGPRDSVSGDAHTTARAPPANSRRRNAGCWRCSARASPTVRSLHGCSSPRRR